MAPSADVTRLLAAWGTDDEAARAALLEAVYPRLRRLARSHLRHERRGQSLPPTALVHEAYLKLIEQTRVGWRNRAHFFAIAAHAMRRILVDRARTRGALKRGAGHTVSLLDDRPGSGTAGAGGLGRGGLGQVGLARGVSARAGIARDRDVVGPVAPAHGGPDRDVSRLDLLALHRALERLARVDPRQSRLVELRFFGGLTVDETADVLGVAPITVKRDWALARAWLFRELQGRELQGREPQGRKPQGRQPQGRQPQGRQPQGRQPRGAP